MTATPLELPEALKRRDAFIAEALAAQAQMIETGKGFDAADVHAWLRAQVAGRKTRMPQLTSWRH
jgi:predicted transcriptional regulator